MNKYLVGSAAGASLALAIISGASALPSGTSMREGGYALAPFSFIKFCIAYPDECPTSSGPSRVELTAGLLEQLGEVNRAVNAAIAPTPDTSKLRYWHLNVTAGDCNSFAIQKRHQLTARGWPAGALALTVVKTPWDEGHLVVTVRTDQGDLVLDNLRSSVVSWRQTGYQFIMRQSENNPQYWVELNGGQASAAFAARRPDGIDKPTEAGRQAVDAEPAEFSVLTAPKRIGRGLVALASLGLAKGQSANDRISEDQAVETWAVSPVNVSSPEAAKGFSSAEATASDKIVADLTRWLTHGRLIVAAAAQLIDGFVADLGRRLVDSREVAEAEPARSSITALDSPIDPTAYGFI